jgi:hypothetical protein
MNYRHMARLGPASTSLMLRGSQDVDAWLGLVLGLAEGRTRVPGMI